MFFSSILLILVLSVEFYILYHPNSFSVKAMYLKKNTDINVLFLGSSHVQNGVNPKYVDLKAANLAYGSQDIQLNSALFFKNVKKLARLKILVLELDYHTLEEKNPRNYFRLPWYYKYYGIKIGQISLLNKIFLYSTSPKFFMDNIFQNLSTYSKTDQINDYGFVENDFDDIFKKYKYNPKVIIQSSKERLKKKHANQSVKNYTYNKKEINKMITYCIERNVKVVLLAPPVYRTYYTVFIPEKESRRKIYLDSLTNLKQKQLFIWNFEKDDRFQVTDFKNDDHLNSTGAIKFSKIVNNKFKSL